MGCLILFVHALSNATNVIGVSIILIIIIIIIIIHDLVVVVIGRRNFHSKCHRNNNDYGRVIVSGFISIGNRTDGSGLCRAT
jgi:hypothetical protein